MVTTVKSLVHSNGYNSQIGTTVKSLQQSNGYSTYNKDRAFNNLVHSQQQTPFFERGGGGVGGVGGGPPLAPCPSVVTILQSLQHSNRYNTQMVTTLNSLQHLHQYRTQIVTTLTTTTGLSTTLSTHNSKPLFLNPTARPSGGGGGGLGLGPAAGHKHIPEINQWDRKKTSRGPVII